MSRAYLAVEGLAKKRGGRENISPYPKNLLTMSIAPQLSEWLEHPAQQAQLSALSAATTLPEMVLLALQLGLGLARWLLERDLTRRGEAAQSWGTCPHCGHRLHSKGFQRRQLQTLVGPIG